ncbi:MAG TPA: family 10 glycosylhydrolase [Flavisolibacter sp.]|nr:family 10 glycosylhydrolase [Flavisolibacter sp.]
MNRNLLSFFCLFLFLAGNTQNQPKRELRGAWIASYLGIDWPNKNQSPAQQRAALVNILDQHQATGINTIYLQVRSQCDALYPSSIEPWSSDLTGIQGQAPSDPSWDPLQFAIQEAHKRGMELHAWINPYRAVATASKLPSFSAQHVAKQHPEWLITNGSTITLNPGLEEVRDYIMSVITDIVSRYDIDGVHFDDYFYPPGSFNDDAAYNNDPRSFPATAAGRADWRRDNVNMLIKRVYETVIATKPWVKFGVSPSGIYRSSTNPEIGSATSSGALQHYSAVFADSKKWLQEGWVDYIEPQVYWYIGQGGSDYKVLIPWWNNQANGRHIYIGMAGYKVSTTGWTSRSQVPDQVRMNRSEAYPNIYGQANYNTTSLRNNALNFRDSLRERFYQHPSLQPLMSWRDNTPPMPAMALTAIKYADDSIVLYWTRPAATENELDKAKRYVVYRSETPEVDINNGENIIAITNDTSIFADKTISPGATYYYAVTALDRFQNESSTTNIATYAPPAITCPGNQELSLDAACAVVLPDYTTLAIINNGAAGSAPYTIVQSPAAGSVINGAGSQMVILTVADPAGNTAACSFNVITEDHIAPVITAVNANPSVLQVPNHKMREVKLLYTTADNCGPVTSRLTVTSNEDQGGENDWEVLDDHRIKLRAERLGTGSGRIYTITITSTDLAGNSSSQDLQVVVPHDQNEFVTQSRTNGAKDAKELSKEFTVTISPNPSSEYFTIHMSAMADKQATIKVSDNTGRVIEVKNGIAPNSSVRIGAEYRPGVYYLEIMQGNSIKTYKLLKKGK